MACSKDSVLVKDMSKGILFRVWLQGSPDARKPAKTASRGHHWDAPPHSTGYRAQWHGLTHSAKELYGVAASSAD